MPRTNNRKMAQLAAAEPGLLRPASLCRSLALLGGLTVLTAVPVQAQVVANGTSLPASGMIDTSPAIGAPATLCGR